MATLISVLSWMNSNIFIIHCAYSQEQNQLCISKKADIIVSIHIKINLLLIAFCALWRLSLYCASAGLILVCNPSYELRPVVMKLNEIHCYSCVESTAARPVTETDDMSTAQLLAITLRRTEMYVIPSGKNWSTLPAALGHGVYTASNRNEYQKHKNNNVSG
jgi:hypothetical protein